MTPEENEKNRKATIQELAKAIFGLAFSHFTPPVVSIATIIVISPAKGSFAHFLDACKKSGWIHPDGRVKQNHIRASQHVKNHFENYNIYVAKKLPSDYPTMIHDDIRS